MTGLDTNVLVRYLTQDDPAQSAKAVQAIESAVERNETLFITGIVVCELVWVLEGAYGYSRTDIADALEKSCGRTSSRSMTGRRCGRRSKTTSAARATSPTIWSVASPSRQVVLTR